jgi:hypothetical protein
MPLGSRHRLGDLLTLFADRLVVGWHPSKNNRINDPPFRDK